MRERRGPSRPRVGPRRHPRARPRARPSGRPRPGTPCCRRWRRWRGPRGPRRPPPPARGRRWRAGRRHGGQRGWPGPAGPPGPPPRCRSPSSGCPLWWPLHCAHCTLRLPTAGARGVLLLAALSAYHCLRPRRRPVPPRLAGPARALRDPCRFLHLKPPPCGTAGRAGSAPAPAAPRDDLQST